MTRAKRRPPGVGCQYHGRKSCRRDAVTSVRDVRLCAMHAADRLFSIHVRAEAERCWAYGYEFGCNGELQCAHLVRGRSKVLRWADDGAVALCAGHHVWFTHHNDDWKDYVEDRGIDYDALLRRRETDPPMDPMAVIDRLQREEA